MDTLSTKFLALLSALLLCVAACAQGSIYTRKARISDFPSRTLKVVSSGSSFIEQALREEVSARWRLSPFEFSSEAEYNQLRSSNDYYFLTLASDGEVAFLSLSKGGKEDESDNLKKPFELIRIPIADAANPSGTELMTIGAFVDVLQYFVEDAMSSDPIAYRGLSHYNSRRLDGRGVVVDPEAVSASYESDSSTDLVGIVVAPSEPGPKSKCYKMLISCDSHELFYYKESPYKSADDASFSTHELKSFAKRNGVLPR